ncbi:MAG: hypothetical protein AB4426_11705 [Xenococcaceae cyanobacterium]
MKWFNSQATHQNAPDSELTETLSRCGAGASLNQDGRSWLEKLSLTEKAIATAIAAT